MKRVLVIAYFYPYREGSVRVLPLVKHLPEFGWEPVVLTAPLRQKPELDLRVIETPYRDVLGFWKKVFRLNPDEDVGGQIKRWFGVTSRNSLIDFLLRCGGELFQYPDYAKGWKPSALAGARAFLQRENIDAVISIWPVTSHLVAKEVKGKHEVPWIADFPDLWSQNSNYGYSPLRRMLDRRLEVKTLSSADCLITVSEPLADKLRTMHQGKPVYTITHGFDPAEVNMPPAKLTAKFTITYTGSIYTRKQEPSKLFAALRGLISDGTMNPNEVEIRFYGNKHDWLDKEIERYGLANIVKQHGLVPREVALEKQRESQLLLLLKWEDPEERGVYTGKIFEYLAARRPILATGGFDDVVDDLLDETKAGIAAPTTEDIRNTLEESYGEYKLKGEVIYRAEEAEIDKYSHRAMSRKFSEILDHLT